MVHVPMLAHENPKRVLIVGGGDGGVLREICRHEEVEHVDMCEIDNKVCELVQQYEFSTAVSFSDPRLNLVHEDGAKFVKRQGTIISSGLRVGWASRPVMRFKIDRYILNSNYAV